MVLPHPAGPTPTTTSGLGVFNTSKNLACLGFLALTGDNDTFIAEASLEARQKKEVITYYYIKSLK
jgi:hypothetical protein